MELGVGQRIIHDFSRVTGTITRIEPRRGKYRYYVEWDGDMKSRSDWYHKDVLELPQGESHEIA